VSQSPTSAPIYSEEEFDRVVDPAEMVRPYVATAD
jgi:hypothetical protein